VPAGGGGGGGAGGLSWIASSGLHNPASFNAGAGQVVLTYPSTTGTALSSSLNPAFQGQAVTFTARVTSPDGTPTGNVTFNNGATPLGAVALDAGGVATFTTNSLPVGSLAITAAYGGAPTFAGSASSPLTQVVNPFSLGLRLVAGASPAAVSVAGQTITYTLTVTNTGSATMNGITAGATPTAPAGPAPDVPCTPGTIAPGLASTCTGTYTVTAADLEAVSGEIVLTFSATGTDAVFASAVASNLFAVSVDVRAPQPGWTALLVNTTNSIGVTP
jgi:hypothetical protein